MKIRTTVTLLLVLIMALLLSACGMLKDAAQLQSYDFGDDKIPSFTSAVGERNVTSIQTGSSAGGGSYKAYTYDVVNMQDDIDGYYYALSEAGYIVTRSLEGDALNGNMQYAANSTEDGQILVVELSWEGGNKLTVEAIKTVGTITLH